MMKTARSSLLKVNPQTKRHIKVICNKPDSYFLTPGTAPIVKLMVWGKGGAAGLGSSMITNNPELVSSRWCCLSMIKVALTVPLSVQALTKIDDRLRLYLGQPVAALDDMAQFAAELGVGQGGGGGGDGTGSYEDWYNNKDDA